MAVDRPAQDLERGVVTLPPLIRRRRAVWLALLVSLFVASAMLISSSGGHTALAGIRWQKAGAPYIMDIASSSVLPQPGHQTANAAIALDESTKVTLFTLRLLGDRTWEVPAELVSRGKALNLSVEEAAIEMGKVFGAADAADVSTHVFLEHLPDSQLTPPVR